MKQKSIPNIPAKTHYQPVKAPRTLLELPYQKTLRGVMTTKRAVLSGIRNQYAKPKMELMQSSISLL